jgi:hypothetical protein
MERFDPMLFLATVRLLFSCVYVSFLVTCWSAAMAQNAEMLKVQLVPSTLEVPTNASVQAFLSLENPTSDVLQNIRISSFSNEAVELHFEPQEPNQDHLEPGEALARVLVISRKGQERVSGNLFVRIDFKRPDKKNKGKLIPRVVFATLQLQDRHIDFAADLAEVQVNASGGTLNERNPGTIYVTIRNKSAFPIRGGVLTQKPDFINLDTKQSAFDLAPYESTTIKISMMAESLVRPGKHLLFFQIPLQWSKDGNTQSGTLIATSEIEVGVLGESIILTAIGVPSFLLLPGFLVVATVAFLWKLFAPKNQKDKFPLAANSPDFWLIAITLSIASAFVYPRITKWLQIQRDYLSGYGLTDVVYVWVGSVIFGLITFLLLTVLISLWITLRRLILRAYQFSTEDSAIEFLGKLGKRNLGPYLERATFITAGTDPDACFFVEKASEIEAWVAPYISVKWNQEIATANQQRDVERQLAESGSAAKLAKLLGKKAKDAVQVNWKPSGKIEELQRVKEENIERTGKKGLAIETT